ncbi:unnamed protein product [Absidia cylindrospora]
MNDIAKRFGKQEMLRNVITGGSWVHNGVKRKELGQEAQDFITNEDGKFFDVLFGTSRQFEDHCSQETTLYEGTYGIFTSNVATTLTIQKPYFIGKVEKCSDTFEIIIYEVDHAASTDLYVATTPTSRRIPIADASIQILVDMNLSLIQ